jgi:TPR repeat protein
MTPSARTIRVSAAALCLGLAGVWLSGCSEASRLEIRCLTGSVPVCIQLGDMYAAGKGVPRDLGRAARAYGRACEGGAADVCNTLGEIVEQTGAVEGGQARAEQLFLRACDGGSSPGCLNLGHIAAARDDKVRAFALFEKSCNGGWAAGCHQVAASYEEGEGVGKDIPKAVEFYTQSCDGEYVESCTVLANLYLAGEAVAKDIDAAIRFNGKALKVYAASCQAGNQADCAEGDKLRNRVAILVASQQTARPAAPPPVIK